MQRILATRLRPGDVLASGSVVQSHPVRTKQGGVQVTVVTSDGNEHHPIFDTHDLLSVTRAPRPF